MAAPKGDTVKLVSKYSVLFAACYTAAYFLFVLLFVSDVLPHDLFVGGLAFHISFFVNPLIYISTYALSWKNAEGLEIFLGAGLASLLISFVVVELVIRLCRLWRWFALIPFFLIVCWFTIAFQPATLIYPRGS